MAHCAYQITANKKWLDIEFFDLFKKIITNISQFQLFLPQLSCCRL